MGKTSKPLTILVTGSSAQELYGDPTLQAMKAQGHNIDYDNDSVLYDAIIGDNCLYAIPQTMKITLDAIKNIQKKKPKPPKKDKKK